MYNTLFLSTTVIHRTWLDKINSKDYHFATELRSTLSSQSKYECVKCNTDKLLNITALNMTVTRLPSNLASKTHNFPLRGIICPFSNHSFYFLQSKKWLGQTYALPKKKKRYSFHLLTYISLRRRLMRRYWISAAQSEYRRENQKINQGWNRLPASKQKNFCARPYSRYATLGLCGGESYLHLTRIRVLTLREILPRKINLSSHLLTLHKRFA